MVIVIDIIKDIANQVAPLGSAGNLGQEIGPIIPGTNVSEAGFIHSHRFTSSVIADGIAFLLKH